MSGPSAASHFLGEAAAWPYPWGLAIGDTGRMLARQVTVAGDSRARRTGLLGREAMSPDHALILAPCQGIHTFGMRFPIDVVGVAQDGQVVRIVDSLAPWRIALSWRAFAIVELSAGSCRDVGLMVGAILRATRLEHPHGS